MSTVSIGVSPSKKERKKEREKEKEKKTECKSLVSFQRAHLKRDMNFERPRFRFVF